MQNVLGVQQTIRSLLVNDVGLLEAAKIPLDAPLSAHGLNSLGMVHSVAVIEDVFNVEIPDEHLDRKHFRSIETMTTFVCEVLRSTQVGTELDPIVSHDR